MKRWMLLWFILLAAVIPAGCENEDRNGKESGGQKFQQLPAAEDLIGTLNLKDRTVSFMNGEGSNLGKWKLSRPYTGGWIMPNGDTLVLYGPLLKTADIFSLGKGELVQSLHTGQGVANGRWDSRTGTYIFANKKQGKIQFFQKDGTREESMEFGPYPLHMEIVGRRMYVSDYKDATVDMIDLDSRETVRSIPVHRDAAGLLIDEERNEIWTGGHGEADKARETAAVYSLKNGRLVKEVKAPLMPIAFLESGNRVFILSHGTNRLYRYDRDTEDLASLEIGANPFALESFHGKILVAGYDSNELYFIDPDTLKLTGRAQTGEGPFIILKRETMQ